MIIISKDKDRALFDTLNYFKFDPIARYDNICNYYDIIGSELFDILFTKPEVLYSKDKIIFPYVGSQEMPEEVKEAAPEETKANKEAERLNIKEIERKEKKSAWNLYRKRCRELTLTNDLSVLENFNEPRVKCKNDFFDPKKFSIDHKVSIFYGFSKSIPFEHIAHISNLRLIPSLENLRKGTKNYIDDLNKWVLLD
jgi:hypothetical protein